MSQAQPSRVAPAPARVLLVGMMGAGKTSVGHALVEATGWPFLDNDEAVQQLTGLSTPRLMDSRGVEAMRDAESQALQLALTRPVPLVAGVAGGAVTRADDRARLSGVRDGLVVYLRASLDTIIERVGDGHGRPWLAPDPAAAVRELFTGRDPLYREVSGLVLEVEGQDPKSLAERILDQLPAG